MQYDREVSLFSDLVRVRNGTTPTYEDGMSSGTLFVTTSNTSANERNFSNMYEAIFALNEFEINPFTITKWDEKIDAILDAMDSSPMWYELTSDDIAASRTPDCRVASLDYYMLRNTTMLVDRMAVKELPIFERMAEFKDLMIWVDNDYYVQRRKQVPLIKMLRFRINEELNSHYVTHPSEFMLVYIIALKAMEPGYFDYGLRFIQRFMERIRSEEYDYYHLPVEYRSDGSFVNPQYHTRLPMILRIIINRLSLFIYYVEIHSFKREYLDMHDELFMFFASDPFENGKKFKKAFTAINLYYGMDTKGSPAPHLCQEHYHPWYNVTENDITDRPPVFNAQSDCTGICMTVTADKLDRACYSRSVRDFISEGINDIDKLGLPNTKYFIQERLIAARYNEHIIRDLVAVRMAMGSLGYARSHKIADVVDDIISNYQHNIDHAETKEYKAFGPQLCDRLRTVGKEQTLRLIREGKYPNSEHFHASISTYLTSKSSGAAPISVAYTLRDKKTGKIRHMKQSLNSKAARAMFSGDSVFNLSSIRPKYKSIFEYYEQLPRREQERIFEEGLSPSDVNEIGIYTIGSRATTATRAIRGIFVIPIQLHMAFCAIAKPHVDETSHPPESGNKSELFINDANYGAAILTQYQDGSLDAYAPFIQASASRRYIISAADASAWDQHCKFELMASWIAGIRDAFCETAAADKELYMHVGGDGINLVKICEEVIEFLRFGLFSLKYGDALRVVETNFMLSGLLVTFLLNSIINSEINYALNNDMSADSTKILSMLIAGDDIGSILKLNKIGSAEIEALREQICAKYTAAGHKINKNKSVMSNRSIEMAKIYAHLGFTFNDPYMQVNESEKSGKDESKVSLLRGFVHKQFDAFRRSNSKARVTCFVMRMCTMMAYHIKMFSTNVDSDKTKYKYYPPYAACVLPSAIKGGIGCTWTGVALNESIWLQEQMSSCVATAIDTVDALRFDSQEIFASSFLKNVIPDDKHHLIPRTDRQPDIEILSVNVSSTSARDAELSIDAGINYKMRHLKAERVSSSNEAHGILKGFGINIDEGLKYENAPIMDMIQFSSTLKRSMTANRDEFSLNVNKLFDIKKGFLPTIKPVARSIYKYYKINGMVNYAAIPHELGVVSDKYFSVRRPIAPDVFRNAERRFGARWGDAVKLNLMGLNKALQRFVSVTGSHVTAEVIQAAMIKHNMFSEVNAEELIVKFLTAVSGDLNAATQAAGDMQNVNHTWADMMVASTVNGTCAEYLDVKIDNINDSIMVLTTLIPSPLTRLLKYSAFTYLLGYEAYYGRTIRHLELTPNKNTMRLVGETKKAKYKVKDHDVRQTEGILLHEELYETFERLKIEYDGAYRILTDDHRS
uniref:RNA-directed RNA polymerase n=1 Tax=Atrato Reo-like virus TaxID=2689356 RepID=A0A6B9KGW4_9REOV|nr:putative RdRp [Atrato Reo-like virus]